MSPAVKLSWPATHEFWEIPVLFEDEHLLALEKPAGLLTALDRQAPDRPSLPKLLQDSLSAGKPWARERNLTYLALAHRLDADTSGVLLLAKTKLALLALADQFGSGAVTRQQVILIQGVPTEDAMVVAQKLAPHPLQPGRLRVDSRHGKKATSEFAVLERFSRWSLLRGILRQERPEQIPLHLNYMGFPVVGDEGRGGKKLWLSRLKRDFHLKPGREERPLISRVMVHLEEVNLVHPVTQRPLSLRSEWPKDLRVALKYLRQYARTAAA